MSEDETWRDYESKLEVRLDVVETLLDQGSVPRGLAIMSQMRAEGDTTPELDYLQGRALFLQGMHSEAEALLISASEKMKRDGRPHATLGLLYADTKRPEDAIAALRKSLEHDEANAKTWNNLGFVLTSGRHYEEAVEALRQAVRLDGTVRRYRNNLGFALHASGHPRDALQTFMTTGSPADAHANMALAYELQGTPDKARDEYQVALKNNPDHTTAKEGLARVEAHEESP
ncbi:MAG: tetratricopeptide repeat protein [Proteobacteria bacterium]|nr:tetratricopeptide repeat protein [Pseudomonadota bacterium]